METKIFTHKLLTRGEYMMKEVRERRDAWARTKGYQTYAEYVMARDRK